MKPVAYNMTKYEDRIRWCKEMFGYLKTQNFLKEGTDFEGRKFAFDALVELSEIIATEDEVEK